MIVYRTKKQLIRINKATIDVHGGNYVGPFNFLHESNLDYLIECVQAEMFGLLLYPTIFDKAALYGYNIICNHIFKDGNKRTGLAGSLLFLNLNSFKLDDSISNEKLTQFILSVASGEISLDECRTWFTSNTSPLITRRKGPDEKH